MFELAASVVALRGCRKDFDDDRGIEERPTAVWKESALATRNDDVRVRVKPGCAHVDAHIRRVHPAVTVAELCIQGRNEVRNEHDVWLLGARHGEHLAVVILVTSFG